MNWWSLSLALSGWQVSTLQRPSRLAPLLAVSARNLSINWYGDYSVLQGGLSRSWLQHHVVHEGRSGECHRRQKGLSMPNKNLCVHHWKLSSPVVSIWHLSPPLGELLTFQGRYFFCLLLMLGCFSSAKGPLVSKVMVRSEGLALPC